MKKIAFFFLLLTSLLPGLAHAEQIDAETADDTPTLHAQAAILMESSSGEVLFEKNADQKMYPASITKLMTILLALENSSLTDEISFSHNAVYSIEPGSAHIAIQEGEVLTMEQALRAIILRSANEVSNAVAEHVDGSVEAFAQHMTQRAQDLGCKNTNFVNANGLHNESHVTTARDMALIARELLTHPEYRAIMSETYYEIPPTNLQSETRYLHGQHQMLNPNSIYYYEGAIGGKTGYTNEAKNTLVTYAKKGDMELIAVVLQCNGAEHYVDTAALFDYGFANFKMEKIFSADDYAQTVAVTEDHQGNTITLGEITAKAAGDVSLPLPINADTDSLQITVNCPQSVEAPVAAGDEIGSASVSMDGRVLQTIPLNAQEGINLMTDAEHSSLDTKARQQLSKKIGIGFGIAFLLCLLLLGITRTIGYLRYRKRRKNRKKRMQKRNRK